MAKKGEFSLSNNFQINKIVVGTVVVFIVMQKTVKELGELSVCYMQKSAYIDIITTLKPA